MSRKVTTETVQAFLTHQHIREGNTHTDSTGLYLHGHKIAEWRHSGKVKGTLHDVTPNELWITNAGWPTVTTRERLNGLPGVRVNQSKGEQYLNGKPWDGSWIKV